MLNKQRRFSRERYGSNRRYYVSRNLITWSRVPLRHPYRSLTYPDFQIADFIEFDRLEPRINHWQRITGYGISGSELVFGVSASPDAEEKFSGRSSDAAAYR